MPYYLKLSSLLLNFHLLIYKSYTLPSYIISPNKEDTYVCFMHHSKSMLFYALFLRSSFQISFWSELDAFCFNPLSSLFTHKSENTLRQDLWEKSSISIFLTIKENFLILMPYSSNWMVQDRTIAFFLIKNFGNAILVDSLIFVWKLFTDGLYLDFS